MVWGIFLGYRFAPGGRWNGEYLTAELTDFVDQSLRIDAGSYDYRVTPHVTKQARLGTSGVAFPLRARYDHMSLTLEGLDPALEKGDALVGPPDSVGHNTGAPTGTTAQERAIEDKRPGASCGTDGAGPPDPPPKRKG